MKLKLFAALMCLTGLLFTSIPTIMAQQELSKSDQRYVKRFLQYSEKVEQRAQKGDWKYAAYYLKTMDWYISKWKKAKLENHPEIAPLFAKYKELQVMVKNKKVPNSGSSGSGSTGNSGGNTPPKGSYEKLSKTDLHYITKFHKYAKWCKKYALQGKWDEAQRSIRQMKWYVDKWKKEKKSANPKLAEVYSKFNKYQSFVANRKLPVEKKIHYVRRIKGKARRGGTLEKPAKYLWREMRKAKPGSEIRVSGDFQGWRGVGEVPIKSQSVTLRGGYSPDFSIYNPWKYPTVFRKEGNRAKSLSKVMMDIPKASGVVIEGIVFDQSPLNIYKNGNIDLQYCPKTVILTASFSRKLIIRNCVFINSSGGGLRIKATGPGTAIVENCIFINCVQFGVQFRGYDKTDSSKLIVKNCTFSNILPYRNTVGSAIYMGSTGALVAKNNVFSHCDTAITSLLSNNRISMTNNVAHALQVAFYYYSEGSKVAKAKLGGEDLDEVDITGDIEGNVLVNPKLSLDPLSQLKYLKSKMRYGVKKEILAADVAHYESQLKATSNGQEKKPEKKEEKPAPKKTEKKEEKKKKDDPFGGGGFDDDKKDKKKKDDDPFGGGGFGDDKEKKEEKKTGTTDPFGGSGTGSGKKTEKKTATGKTGKGGVVQGGYYYGQIYPASKAWVFPTNSQCKAGALPGKK